MRRPPLERRYRRLLWAYPRGLRRDELLDTLMQAAPPGRSRPSLRESADLVRHGLRARLGRPGRRGVVVLAVLIALSSGFAGGALAARAAWEAAPDFPAGPRLAEITGTVFTGLPVEGGRSAGGLFFDPSMRGTAEVFRSGHTEDFEFATYDFGPRDGFVIGDYRTWTDQAAHRLESAGWTLHDIWPTGPTMIATGRLEESGRSLLASRDGLTVELETSTDVVGTPAGGFHASASLSRGTPAPVIAATIAGWLVAGLTGWLATGWAVRRTAECSPGVRLLAGTLVGVALFFQTPLTLLGTVGFLSETWAATPSHQPFWSLSVTWFFGCTILGVLLALAALGVAALGGRRPTADPHAAFVAPERSP